MLSVPFPYGVWERKWHSTVSVHDHCLCIYFVLILVPTRRQKPPEVPSIHDNQGIQGNVLMSFRVTDDVSRINEKSRECHNHKPKQTHDTKMKKKKKY